MTETTFFIRFRGEVSGPVSSERLSQLIASGAITALHELSNDQTRWTTVRTWLTSQTAPPPIPGTASLPNETTSQFRIHSERMPAESDASLNQSQSIDVLGLSALAAASLGVSTNLIWIIRSLIMHLESGLATTLFMFSLPVLLSGMAFLASVLRLIVGGRRKLAIASCAIATLSLVLAGTGLLLDTFESPTTHQANDESTPEITSEPSNNESRTP